LRRLCTASPAAFLERRAVDFGDQIRGLKKLRWMDRGWAFWGSFGIRQAITRVDHLCQLRLESSDSIPAGGDLAGQIGDLTFERRDLSAYSSFEDGRAFEDRRAPNAYRLEGRPYHLHDELRMMIGGDALEQTHQVRDHER
jgi:hypothetical protein